MKVDLKEMQVEVDDEMTDCSIEEVGGVRAKGSSVANLLDSFNQMAEELPEFSPRYIVFSYCHAHGDGRVSYPLMFIYYCPSGPLGGLQPPLSAGQLAHRSVCFPLP